MKLTVAEAPVRCGTADRLFFLVPSKGRDAVQREADLQDRNRQCDETHPRALRATIGRKLPSSAASLNGLCRIATACRLASGTSA